MTKSRLEAFSDGVLAIILTIMVLELKVPHGEMGTAPALSQLLPLWPVFLSYLLSFVYIGIYWNNHHHLFQAVKRVDGRILWANLHLLFWLSLIPFTTGWLGENHFAPIPTALYGVSLLMPAVAYTILTRVLLARHGPDSLLAKALGSDTKGRVSLGIYVTAVPTALFLHPWLACALYLVVALIWIAPDLRIERLLRDSSESGDQP